MKILMTAFAAAVLMAVPAAGQEGCVAVREMSRGPFTGDYRFEVRNACDRPVRIVWTDTRDVERAAAAGRDEWRFSRSTRIRAGGRYVVEFNSNIRGEPAIYWCAEYTYSGADRCGDRYEGRRR